MKIKPPLLEAKPEQGVAIYVVYFNTRDIPGLYSIRRQVASNAGIWVDPQLWAKGSSLAEVRDALPAGLHGLPPMPGDDPVVVEIWL